MYIRNTYAVYLVMGQPLSLDSLSGVNFDSRQNRLNQGRIGGFPLGLVEAGRKKISKIPAAKKKYFS